MKSKRNPHPKQKSTAISKSKLFWIIPSIVVLAAVVGVTYWISQSDNKRMNSTYTPPTQTLAKVNQDQLIGRWTRTDSEGNYIMEIKNAAADGKLDVLYFNPNPINVGHAEWHNKNGSLMIVVELRDVNYPGSTYTLNFIPSENRMTGNYFQAVEGTNFAVEFVRAR